MSKRYEEDDELNKSFSNNKRFRREETEAENVGEEEELYEMDFLPGSSENDNLQTNAPYDTIEEDSLKSILETCGVDFDSQQPSTSSGISHHRFRRHRSQPPIILCHSSSDEDNHDNEEIQYHEENESLSNVQSSGTTDKLIQSGLGKFIIGPEEEKKM